MVLGNTKTLFSTLVAIFGALSFAYGDFSFLDPKEWLLNTYIKPPTESLFKVHFFNITNPKAVASGSKPSFQDVGPYVYRVKFIKDEIKIDDSNSKATFHPKKTYEFAPDLTGSLKEEDPVYSINGPLMIALNKIKWLPEAKRKGMESFFKHNLSQEPVFKASAGELVWGLSNPILNLEKSENGAGFKLYGLIFGRNFSDWGTATVNTGLNQPYLGEVLEFKPRAGLGTWQSNTHCSVPEGTLGGQFKPRADRCEKLHYFTQTICRELPFEFEREVTYQETVKADRFQVSADSAYDMSLPENSCYCESEGGCDRIPKGLFNMTSCLFGNTFYMSLPHFLKGEDSLLEAVDGLNPDPELHNSFMDIYQPSGTVLRNKYRHQLNLQIPNLENSIYKGLPEMYFPVLWYSDETEFTNMEELRRLKNVYKKPFEQTKTC